MLDRLFALLGYVPDGPREYPRAHTGGDAVTRGERWQQFYSESGGIKDMIDALRYDYFQGYTRLAARDYDARDRAAQFDIVLAQLDAKVRNIIDTGKMDSASQAQAQRFVATIRK